MPASLPRTRIALRLRNNPDTVYDEYESCAMADEALAKMDHDISQARTLMESIRMSSGMIEFPKSQFISAYIV